MTFGDGNMGISSLWNVCSVKLITVRRREPIAVFLRGWFCSYYHCIAAYFSSAQSVSFLQLICRKKVILVSCHWRAALPSHKSITLHTSVLMNLNLKHKTASCWVNNELYVLFLHSVCVSVLSFSVDYWSHIKHPPSLSREVISPLLEYKIVKSKRERHSK